jgi:hypothetical protein
VNHGFSAEYLDSISLEKRRFFFNLLAEKNKKEQESASGKSEASVPLSKMTKEKIKSNS